MMAYRRSPSDVVADRAWPGFVEKNRALFDNAGLPLLAARSAAHLADLLTHGIFDHHADPTHFSTDSLSDAQYRSLLSLATRYFEAGYGWFTPMALSTRDQKRLERRFGTR